MQIASISTQLGKPTGQKEHTEVAQETSPPWVLLSLLVTLPATPTVQGHGYPRQIQPQLKSGSQWNPRAPCLCPSMAASVFCPLLGGSPGLGSGGWEPVYFLAGLTVWSWGLGAREGAQ